jgi:ribosomal protein S8
LLAKVFKFQIVLTVDFVCRHKSGFNAVLKPSGYIGVRDSIETKREAGSTQQLGIGREAAEVIHDRHQTAIEDLRVSA